MNWADAAACKRCAAPLGGARAATEADGERAGASLGGRLLRRALVVVGVVALFIAAAYVSLLITSEPVTAEQRQLIHSATRLLDERGFGDSARLLRLATYRSTDNWWNRYVGHREAYAAVNFPFQVVTLYPDFFSHPTDDTERAVILLHEAYHLAGSGEERAFSGVWRDKERLGWTKERYGQTRVWGSVREFTAQHAPSLFRCGEDGRGDCLEEP
ncbi:MAG TPA: hypothetical protein VK421_09145 [Pyrinomonadaceae bacterium]|nr:hypothetical protein [Pyrinomonadaceae bacterium]